MPGSFKTEAVVLRSIRYGEADRVLALVNDASEAELRATGIPSRAATSTVAA